MSDQGEPLPRQDGNGWRRIVGIVFSLAIVAALLVGVLPRMADFGEVWEAIQTLTWLETGVLLLAAAWNIITYQLLIIAALPGINWLQAFVVGQTSTAITNTLPAGSAVGLGVTYAMFSSMGFRTSSIALATVVTGVWNTFVKLGLPIGALVALTLTGRTNAALQSAALVGMAVLVGMIAVLWLALASERGARRSGELAQRVVTRLARPFRKGPFEGWGASVVQFRAQSIDLLSKRWHWITVTTLLSHLSLFYLLFLSLRHMGVPHEAVSASEALAVFALVRLVTVIPITPGNLGVVEVGLTAGLVVAGGPESLVVAAVLIYRALSYLLQVPLGILGWVIWRAKGWGEPQTEG